MRKRVFLPHFLHKFTLTPHFTTDYRSTTPKLQVLLLGSDHSKSIKKFTFSAVSTHFRHIYFLPFHPFVQFCQSVPFCIHHILCFILFNTVYIVFLFSLPIAFKILLCIFYEIFRCTSTPYTLLFILEYLLYCNHAPS